MSKPDLPPDADTLLDAISWFLEERVLPELGPYDRFQGRVALNLLGQVRRELASAPAQEAAERARIDGLLEPAAGPLSDRRLALARAIRSGRLDWRDPDLWTHMRMTMQATLEFTNPRWLRKSAES